MGMMRESSSVEIDLIAGQTIGLDGAKIHANASRHSALSYEHAGKIEAQLQAEVGAVRSGAAAGARDGRAENGASISLRNRRLNAAIVSWSG